MQTRVLIGLVTDAMFCAGGARQQGCGRAAVEVVNNVIIVGAQLTSNARARRSALALERDHIIHMGKSIEHRSYPVFKQDVDARLRQKSLQCEKGWSCQHRVADGTQPHKKNSLDSVPVPERRG